MLLKRYASRFFAALFAVALAFASVPAAPLVLASTAAYTLATASAEAQGKRLLAAALPGATTYAIVTMTEKRFENANGEPDPDFVTATLQVVFNGSLSGSLTGSVTHAVGASKSQVQAAVRLRVNEFLSTYEPGNTLNNAHIILGGLSD